MLYHTPRHVRDLYMVGVSPRPRLVYGWCFVLFNTYLQLCKMVSVMLIVFVLLLLLYLCLFSLCVLCLMLPVCLDGHIRLSQTFIKHSFKTCSKMQLLSDRVRILI